MIARKPDNGWAHVAGSVWDHVSGMRLHVGGLLRLPDGLDVSANQWPDSAAADACVRRAGGNRRRGLMLWALERLEGVFRNGHDDARNVPRT